VGILMQAIISTDKKELEKINKKMNDYLKKNIANYNARQYGEIKKHATTNHFALFMVNDSRNAYDCLTQTEKKKIVNAKFTISFSEKKSFGLVGEMEWNEDFIP
jgi:hypothetical protein